MRYRVGAVSTTSVRQGVTAAVSPKPTTKRSSASMPHSPCGTSPIAPAPMPQMNVPSTSCFLRPQASDRLPQATAPQIAPTPPLYRMTADCPYVRCHCGPSTASRNATIAKSKNSSTVISESRLKLTQ